MATFPQWTKEKKKQAEAGQVAQTSGTTIGALYGRDPAAQGRQQTQKSGRPAGASAPNGRGEWSQQRRGDAGKTGTANNFSEWVRKKRGDVLWRDEDAEVVSRDQALTDFLQQLQEDATERAGAWNDAGTFYAYKNEKNSALDGYAAYFSKYREQMDKNKDQYDEATYNTLLTAIEQREKTIADVKNALDQEYEYWKQFPDEVEWEYLQNPKTTNSAGRSVWWRGENTMEAYQKRIDDLDEQIRQKQAEYDDVAAQRISHDNARPMFGVGNETQTNTNPYAEDAAALEKELKILRMKRADAKRQQDQIGLAKYNRIAENDDFEANSAYVPESMEYTWNFFHGTKEYKDDPYFLYEYINGNEEAGAHLKNMDAQAYSGGTGEGLGALYGSAAGGYDEVKEMKPEEIAMFNYLYRTQGRDASEEYYAFLQSDLYRRQREKELEANQKYAEAHPVLATAAAVATSPLKGLSYVGQTADYLTSGHIDENAPYNRFVNYGRDIKGTVVENIDSEFAADAYQYGTSYLEFLTNTAITGGNSAFSLAIMGTGAAAEATIDAKARGLDDDQAFALGTIAGAAEILTEKVSIDALLKPNWSKGALINDLKNRLSEGGEELGSYLINNIADIIIAGDKSEFTRAYQAYKSQGYSDGTAFGLVMKDQAEQMGKEFIGGFMTAGFTADVSAAYHAYGNYRSGQTLREGGGPEAVGNLVQEGLESAPNSRSYRLAQRAQNILDRGGTLSNRQIGALIEANDFAIQAEEQGPEPTAYQSRNAALWQGNPAAEETLTGPVAEFASTMDKAGGSAMTRMYSAVQQPTAYIRDFMQAYSAGKTGAELETVQTGALNPAQAEAAYVAGQADAQNALLARSAQMRYTENQETDTQSAAAEKAVNDYNEAKRALEAQQTQDDPAAAADLQETVVQAETRAIEALNDAAGAYGYAIEPDPQGGGYIASRGDGSADISLDGVEPAYQFVTSLQNTKEARTNGTGAQNALRQGGQWADGSDPGGAVSGMEGRTGQDQSGNLQTRPADAGVASLTYGEKVSVASQGIGGGTTTPSIRMVTGGETKYTQAAKQAARQRGLRLVLFAGGDFTQTVWRNGQKVNVSARAAFVGDRLFVRVDDPDFTADQITRHEIGHDMIEKGEINLDAVRSRIAEAGLEEAVSLYEEAYRDSRLTPEEIFEEIVCDSLGDMNIFARSNAADSDQAQRLLNETKKQAQAELEANKTRGPPQAAAGAKFSARAQRGRSIELEIMENNRFERLRQFADELPPEWYAFTKDYFYIYGNRSFTDYTILEKIKITEQNQTDIDQFTEGLENGTNGYPKVLDRWLENFQRGKGRYLWNRSHVGNRTATNRNDGMDGQPPRGNNVRNTEKDSGVGKAQGEVTPKFSERVQRSKYWHTGWPKAQVDALERDVAYDIEKTENHLTDSANWYYTEKNGKPIFALYSTEDVENPTVLYAVRGEQAKFENSYFLNLMEEIRYAQSTGAGSTSIGEVLENLRVQLPGNNTHRGTGVGAAGNGRNVGVHRAASGCKPRRALISCIENLFAEEGRGRGRGYTQGGRLILGEQEEVTPKFSERVQRSKYWRPNLKKAEWSLLNRLMDTRGEQLDEATYWTFDTEKGVSVFAIYGIGDGSDNTPLYASGGNIARTEAQLFKTFLEEFEHGTLESREAISWVLETLRREQGHGGGHLYDRTQPGAGDVRVHERASRSDGGRTAGQGTGDRGSIKEKFSERVDTEGIRPEEKYAGKSMTEDAELYSYDFLTSMPEMKAVTLPALSSIQNASGKIDTAKVVAAGMKNARAVGTVRDGKVFVRNAYTGKLLLITTDTIRHGLNGKPNRLLTNSRLGAVLGEVVQNAVPINALHNKAVVDGTYAMASYSTDSYGREFVSIITVEQYSGNVSGIEIYDVAHAVSGRQKKASPASTKLQGFYPSTAGTISISEFLQIVNSTHRSILSDDVLAHIGENRPVNGFYNDQVKFSERVDTEGTAQRYDYSKSFAEQIEDYKNGKYPKNDTFLIGGTPDVFQGIGMLPLPVTINQTHVDYALNGTRDFDHYLGENLLKQLPEAIKKPVAIISSKTKKATRLVAILEMRHNGKQVILPVEIDGFGKQNGIRIDSNAIISAYGKNYSISTMLSKALNDEANGKAFSTYYVNVEKATGLLRGARVPMPKMPATSPNGFLHSIMEPGSPVKRKFSDVTETQQFKRWFGDWQKHPESASKVVDEDGRPLVVYHRADESFMGFDQTKGRPAIDIQGSLFSTEAADAAGYGDNVGAYYLNLRNPASAAVAHKALNQFKGQTDAGIKAREYLEGLGYDGVNYGSGEYIAFYPEQIKSATDNIGTFDGANPDVRFSERVDTVGTARQYDYETLVKKPDMKLTVVDDSVKYTANSETRKKLVRDAIKNAAAIGKPNASGGVSVYVDDVGRDVLLSKHGLQHGLDRRLQDNAAVTLHAGEILKNAILINKLTPKRENIADSYVLLGAARGNGGTVYIVEFVVNQYDNAVASIDVLYSLNAKMEPAVLNAPAITDKPLRITDSTISIAQRLDFDNKNLEAPDHNPAKAKKEPAVRNAPGLTGNPLLVTGSTISIAQLLDFANSNFPDILPESVLRHFGYEARPEGNIGESALYSERLASVEELNRIGEIRWQGEHGMIPKEEANRQIREIIANTEHELVLKHGAIKPGEKPFRTAELPKKDANGKKISLTARTVLEAEATPEEMVPNIEEMALKGEFSYDTITDEQALKDAREKIGGDGAEGIGWDAAQRQWFNDIQKAKGSKELTAMGWVLYDNAANSGNTELALDILNAMVQHQREMAQGLQASRILKSLRPETQLYAAKRSTSKLQRELNRRYGKRAPNLKISVELGQKLLDAKTEAERAKALRDIFRDIGKQMPSSFLDKWNAWRYMAMLGNPRTHIRNIAGNAFFAPVIGVKNMTATLIEKAVSCVSGGKLNRSKGGVFLHKNGRMLLKAAWADYANIKDTAMAGGKYSDLQNDNRSIEEGREIFKGKAGKPLEAFRKANSYLLDMEDQWFSQPHYAYALASYCAVNHISPADIRNGNSVKVRQARAYAIKEAQKATYRDSNEFSEFVSKLGKSGKGEANKAAKLAGKVTEGILPFRKTPANILARGIEYSPVGLLNGLKSLYDVSRGKMTGAEVIDRISAGLTGTGILMLGVFLAAQGVLRGRGTGDDKERELEEMMGHQAYAMELPDGTSITLDWLAPECIPLFVGVNLWEQTQGAKKDITMSTVLEAVSTITDPMLEMSCLQSLNDLFDAVGYAKSNEISGLTSSLASAATSYLTQALPTILGQAERTGETERMTTYTGKSKYLTGDFQYTVGKASARIPGWDFNQVPYINAWGETERTENTVSRGINNFLNPAYTSKIEEDELTQMLLELYRETGDGGVIPKRAGKYVGAGDSRKDLDAQEYITYATEKGRGQRQLLEAIYTSDLFLDSDPTDRAAAVGEAYELANAAARMKVDDYAPDGWIGKAVSLEEEGIDPALYILYHLARNKVDEPNENGNLGTYTKAEKAKAIDMLPGLSWSERELLKELENAVYKN